MGKRELILIAVFGLLGVVVYQLTAPPPAPGEQGFSLGRIVDNVRREMRGHNASAEATRTASSPVPDAVSELRVNVLRGPITIVGGPGGTVESELHVRSTGSDVPEATDLVNQTNLVLEQIGSLLIARVEYPTPGRQTVTLRLSVPARLRVRIEGTSSQLDVSGVAAVEAAQAQGETTLRDIAGRVTASHRGGRLTVERVGSLKLTARGSTASLAAIRGDAEISTQGGELTATGLGGSVDLNSSATRVELQNVSPAGGTARLVVVGGALTMSGNAADTRIDLRSAPLDLRLDRATEVAVFSEGNESVRVTAPDGGFRLDAQTRDGRITGEPPELFATWGVSAETPAGATGQRLTGSIGGGGPLLTIRARADIRLAAK
jgi:hypothetical protein